MLFHACLHLLNLILRQQDSDLQTPPFHTPKRVAIISQPVCMGRAASSLPGAFTGALASDPLLWSRTGLKRSTGCVYLIKKKPSISLIRLGSYRQKAREHFASPRCGIDTNSPVYLVTLGTSAQAHRSINHLSYPRG